MIDNLEEDKPRPCDSYPHCDSIRDELNGRSGKKLSREELAMLEMFGGKRDD